MVDKAHSLTLGLKCDESLSNIQISLRCHAEVLFQIFDFNQQLIRPLDNLLASREGLLDASEVIVNSRWVDFGSVPLRFFFSYAKFLSFLLSVKFNVVPHFVVFVELPSFLHDVVDVVAVVDRRQLVRGVVLLEPFRHFRLVFIQGKIHYEDGIVCRRDVLLVDRSFYF